MSKNWVCLSPPKGKGKVWRQEQKEQLKEETNMLDVEETPQGVF